IQSLELTLYHYFRSVSVHRTSATALHLTPLTRTSASPRPSPKSPVRLLMTPSSGVATVDNVESSAVVTGPLPRPRPSPNRFTLRSSVPSRVENRDFIRSEVFTVLTVPAAISLPLKLTSCQVTPPSCVLAKPVALISAVLTSGA